MKKLNIIAATLISSGVILIGFTLGAKYWTYHKQNSMINAYEKKIKNIKHSNNKKVKAAEIKDTIKDGTIGILKIPKIDLKVAIGEGTDLKTLKYAVGHFRNTSMPGQNGNFCLAGHRSYTFGEYFNRLGEIGSGDEIDVETVNGTFKYKVYSTKVVLPSEVHVLDQTKDPTMTLVTCTPIRIATHRLIIKAKRI
ncbi:sortase A [Clostridium acetobutylicum]|uniref:Sortase (Surface protein transpeptidase), YHCS B.subtilis ortholog n=1 Tax=Clostridium acetobutylicum (strain ATCC 824 / DSM 792 / JCM 1419 / IAM 19013 / LMG 5710 / NBRC 13948 / NRRL B-527 / VKM B-1787 / 2291 / W) TaxID=272562 RepID=Q97MJ2_CLOAB|nr:MULTISPECIES: sortase [Clostridium]AAK78186.1 Sortase (surface protein transpeptidase), YHCS B.subtilis ortholog [Clostridium acetobutylicum ATCC 824]ADZ19250.1 Sortase (surface protein transpeptidase) [Clostridium acetobutylicum EA 2018]AEI33790.1 sortase [Clostridium acetobutylicum DSM 1731]AWV81993.1 sortase [Clostridium acetobutylicum]MBC2395938.1 sortase [Clostridium acetobutylicum]